MLTFIVARRHAMLLAFVACLGGCRAESKNPIPTPTTTSLTSPAASTSVAVEPASNDAGLASDTTTTTTTTTTPSLLSEADLPSRARLIAPFRGSKAHGFVAMTAIDRGASQSPGGRRAFVLLNDGDAVKDTKPVLVASFTKLWTAVATLRMVARGELSLDATVKDMIPELASRPWSDSTIKELLRHISRVPEFDEKAGYYRRTDVDLTTPIDVLKKYIPADWAEKRGVYKYRNSELALVGTILAVRAKMPVERVLANEVFEPAKMTNAGLLIKKGPPDLDLAPMGAIRPQNFFTAGAGYASAMDLLSFFEALSGTALLTDASKELLFEGAPERGQGALGCWAYAFAKPDGGTTQLIERPGTFGNVRLFTAFFPAERRAIVAWTGDAIDIARPRAGKGIGFSLARVALE